MISFLQLLIGLVVLTVAADILVRGSVGIAQHLRIPQLVVGLTIVAFGTSAPELVISIKAAAEGSGGIALGNIVGSNIANILIVLGLPSDPRNALRCPRNRQKPSLPPRDNADICGHVLGRPDHPQ